MLVVDGPNYLPLDVLDRQDVGPQLNLLANIGRGQQVIPCDHYYSVLGLLERLYIRQSVFFQRRVADYKARKCKLGLEYFPLLRLVELLVQDSICER